MSSEDRLLDRDSQRPRRSAERVAFNDNLFRRANDSIERSASEIGAEVEHVPFICECAEESCTTVIRVPSDDYVRVRSDSRLFLNAPGHDEAAQGWAKVVERHSQYVVVEKLGRAGEIAEMIDE